MKFEENTLYFGDCLQIMRGWSSECADLVYLDPPFNSDANYNNIFKGSGLFGKSLNPQVKAYEDIWTWSDEAFDRLERVKNAAANPASKVIQGFELFMPKSKMLSYTSYMAERLFECWRVLKPTGSLYLHCDPTANSYLRVIMDAIFGEKNFRNEIVWKRTSSHNSAKRWGPIHDTLLYYSKTEQCAWNRVLQSLTQDYIDKFYRFEDEKGVFRTSDLTGPGKRSGDSGKAWSGYNPSQSGRGRHWALPPDRSFPDWFMFPDGYAQLKPREKLDVLDQQGLIHWPKKEGGQPQFKRYLTEKSGQPLQSLILDIPPTPKNEQLGYPTQKPLALLDRIIRASSNEGDIVLDPFCGCGTSTESALNNKRLAVGIDIYAPALNLINDLRIVPQGRPALPVKGAPTNLTEACFLHTQDPYMFQDWAVSLIPGLAVNPKKSGDGGVDGAGVMASKPVNCDLRGVIAEVTGSPGSQVGKYRALKGVLDDNEAAMGILITLETQTKWREWEQGSKRPSVEVSGRAYPSMQPFSIQEYFEKQGDWKRVIELPLMLDPFTGKPARQNLFSDIAS